MKLSYEGYDVDLNVATAMHQHARACKRLGFTEQEWIAAALLVWRFDDDPKIREQLERWSSRPRRDVQ